jgi:hypothetical protein
MPFISHCRKHTQTKRNKSILTFEIMYYTFILINIKIIIQQVIHKKYTAFLGFLLAAVLCQGKPTAEREQASRRKNPSSIPKKISRAAQPAINAASNETLKEKCILYAQNLKKTLALDTPAKKVLGLGLGAFTIARLLAKHHDSIHSLDLVDPEPLAGLVKSLIDTHHADPLIIKITTQNFFLEQLARISVLMYWHHPTLLSEIQTYIEKIQTYIENLWEYASTAIECFSYQLFSDKLFSAALSPEALISNEIFFRYLLQNNLGNMAAALQQQIDEKSDSPLEIPAFIFGVHYMDATVLNDFNKHLEEIFKKSLKLVWPEKISNILDSYMTPKANRVITNGINHNDILAKVDELQDHQIQPILHAIDDIVEQNQGTFTRENLKDAMRFMAFNTVLFYGICDKKAKLNVNKPNSLAYLKGTILGDHSPRLTKIFADNSTHGMSPYNSFRLRMNNSNRDLEGDCLSKILNCLPIPTDHNPAGFSILDE